ncbi:epimerase family protein SA0724 [Paraliobacillus ryukyuensis]|uniref:TIGR01777 family protein n=1 Tax=Paraliobacillus ryukyuensis TaxID=200904 RepID=A0A366DZ90_9BACI|nr:TIGR01777 family oxidoreductase [Paraliobacillus ryukyuensis]RBO95420.1 hypothetical protein DES48_108133 [Paraliobacillus ryukyuensis]
MNIAIAGGTGFVGTKLTSLLTNAGHHVYILTRSPEKFSNTNAITYVGWLKEGMQPESELQDCDAIINLAGESLFGYWTEEKKQRILSSRVEATNRVIELIQALENKPNVLVNASAVGFYGTSDQKTFTEQTTTAGNDFLAYVTKKWENTANKAAAFDVRVIHARLGIVLGETGTLSLMSLPFKFFVGGPIGSGEQWLSWIHVDDVVRMLLFAIEEKNVTGPMNVTAPKPVRNKVFSQQLASVMHRPNKIKVPSFVIKTLLGEMSILVVEGQAVLPNKALSHDFRFRYDDLDVALQAIYSK